jgi:2-polyprenyl-6-methoxyphenol hydroxylase-like FAD-dependent oxidoreductase
MVLLGDATHAMLPHHGESASAAIDDATTLAEVLPGNAEDGLGCVDGIPAMQFCQDKRRGAA